jgi:GNAT superfamily N-acetyltransferase
MDIFIRQARPDEIESLIPLLLQAKESKRALRWGLKNPVDAVYRADADGVLVGAATMQWRGDPCEIMELAVAPDRHGQGIGRQFVAPSEPEVAEAITLSAHELHDATYPVCLIDHGQRLWAWNRYTPRLVGLHPDDPATARFFGVTTLDLAFNPAFETRLQIENPDDFLPAMLHFAKVDIYPYREQPWYQELIAKTTGFPGFRDLWERLPTDTLRSVVPLRATIPGIGLLQFRMSSADLLLDSRFQLLHFTPFGAHTLRTCADWAEEEGVL